MLEPDDAFYGRIRAGSSTVPFLDDASSINKPITDQRSACERGSRAERDRLFRPTGRLFDDCLIRQAKRIRIETRHSAVLRAMPAIHVIARGNARFLLERSSN